MGVGKGVGKGMLGVGKGVYGVGKGVGKGAIGAIGVLGSAAAAIPGMSELTAGISGAGEAAAAGYTIANYTPALKSTTFQYKSKVKKRTNSPSFEEKLDILIRDAASDILHFKVYDSRDTLGQSSTLIGHVHLPIKELLAKPPSDWIKLKNCSSGKLKISIAFDPVDLMQHGVHEEGAKGGPIERRICYFTSGCPSRHPLVLDGILRAEQLATGDGGFLGLNGGSGAAKETGARVPPGPAIVQLTVFRGRSINLGRSPLSSFKSQLSLYLTVNGRYSARLKRVACNSSQAASNSIDQQQEHLVDSVWSECVYFVVDDWRSDVAALELVKCEPFLADEYVGTARVDLADQRLLDTASNANSMELNSVDVDAKEQ
jgi:hypothetical protein